MASVERFLERRLKLRINRAKSAVAPPSQRKFLGFSFTRGATPKRRIAPQALAKFKEPIGRYPEDGARRWLLRTAARSRGPVGPGPLLPSATTPAGRTSREPLGRFALAALAAHWPPSAQLRWDQSCSSQDKSDGKDYVRTPGRAISS